MTYVKPILINMIVLGVLILSLMSFVIIVQVDNSVNASNRITNNTLINDSYGNLIVDLDKQVESQNSSNALEDVPPQDSVGDLDVASIVPTTRTASSTVVGIWNTIIKLPMVILGVSPIVASAISSILLILLVIGAWAIWKGAIS